MIKSAYFDTLESNRWPTVPELERFFLAPSGREWSYYGGNDSWGFDIQGLHGTEQLPSIERVTVRLYMIGSPDHGVMLKYDMWDGRIRKKIGCYSKGDLGRLHETVRTLHDDLMPVGLFIPFSIAWKGVKQFIETDGELPDAIEWIAGSDLPPDAFPDPGKISAPS